VLGSAVSFCVPVQSAPNDPVALLLSFALGLNARVTLRLGFPLLALLRDLLDRFGRFGLGPALGCDGVGDLLSDLAP
jgi:hypothetical protein